MNGFIFILIPLCILTFLAKSWANMLADEDRIQKEAAPDSIAGPFIALLGQLEAKLAWADILISTFGLVNTE